ncbi:hypothetical protein [Fervidobacterium sp.]
MKRFYWIVLSLTVLLALFSCTQKPMTGPVSVKVNVNLPSSTTVKGFEPRLTGYVSDIEKIYLTVKDSSNQIVLATETTNKTNPSFSFTLQNAGNYSFYVEAKRTDNTKIFTGQRENVTITTGNNEVAIDGILVNGTLRANVEIDSTVWERYNVSNAALEFKKDIVTEWTQKNLTISNAQTTVEESLYPSLYTVRFKISLTAKDQYTTPQNWSNEQNPAQVTIPVDPDRVRNVTFRVIFNSERNEPQVIAVVTQITLPYAPEVSNLTAVWNKNNNELTLSWDYEEQNAIFYIYKELKDNNNTYYEYVGNTQNKTFTLSNFTQSEYDRINGIAINAVVDNRESGLKVLSKSQIQEQEQSQIPSMPENVSANYEDYSQKITLSWNAVSGENVRYKIYKKLTSDNDFSLVQDNITTTTATVDLPLSNWNNLEKVAVSAYNTAGESPKRELAKSDITLLDFARGSGTEQDPYLIGNARQLQNINKSEYLTTGKYFKLIADIDLTGVAWIPIGTYSSNLSATAFVGTFDGNGKKIRNLTYNDSSKSNVGVFGYIYNSTVKNLIIENANIAADKYVGAFAGGVKNSTIERVGVRNSIVTATANTNYPYVGGLIGDVNADNTSPNQMVIRECFASYVTVSAPNLDNARAGGLIGRFYANQVTNAILENCYAIGTVNFKTTNSINIGGLVGLVSRNSSGNPLGTVKITNCYAAVAPGMSGNTSWKGFIGGNSVPATTDSGKNYFDKDVAGETTGSASASLQTGKTTAEMKQQSTFVDWDFTNVWTINEGNDYPRLRWEF